MDCSPVRSVTGAFVDSKVAVVAIAAPGVTPAVRNAEARSETDPSVFVTAVPRF